MGQPQRREGDRSIIPLAAAVVVFLVFALPPYLGLDPSRATVVLIAPAHYPILVAHIGFGAVALVCGCLQAWSWPRRRYPRTHSTLGRVYVFAGALPCAVSTLCVVALAQGQVPYIGHTMAAVLWFATTVAGFAAARRRQFDLHRKWMLYSYAFALNILWGRLVVLLPWDVGLMTVVEVSGWAGWVVNVIAVWFWLNRRPVTRYARPGRTESTSRPARETPVLSP